MGFRDVYNTLKSMPAMGASQAMKLKQAAMSTPMMGHIYKPPVKPLQKIEPMMKQYKPMQTITPKRKMPR